MKNECMAAAILAALAGSALATPTFVNGIAIPGNTTDATGVSGANQGRVGFFSDLYYDPIRGEWWGVSDRGPGGGTLNYDTRVQRFTLDVNPTTGFITNFQITATVKFTGANGNPFTGLAPNPANQLGRSFDPEGFVVNPKTGNFLVADEYGPSVYEFDRTGKFIRAFATPANLIPKVGAATDYVTAPPTLTAGREPNRGFEGLAITPGGKYAYAILQNGTIQDGWTAANRGLYTRIVKFDVATGEAVAQYAYKLESSGQGRGVSAIVALNDTDFLVIERNNRGVGVGATLTPPDKNVYQISLAGATDLTKLNGGAGINLPAMGNLPAGVNAVTKTLKFIDLDANTLTALGNKSPEKWEGLTIGPKLDTGGYVVLAGTDNDYSVTQNGTGTQFDVYFRFSDADPFAASIQCPLDQMTGCVWTDPSLPGHGAGMFDLPAGYSLVPGILHAYAASAGDLASYVVPTPLPATALLLGLGVVGLGVTRRTRRISGV